MWTLLLLHAIFASTYTLGKVGLTYVQPILFVAIRMILSSLLLFSIMMLFWGRSVLSIKRKDYHLFAGLAFFQIYFSYVPEFMVLKYVQSSKWSLIYTLTPFTTALILYVQGKERLSKYKILGLCIGFIGILPAILYGKGGFDISELRHISIPEMVIIMCMVSYSYGWVIAQQLIREHKYNPLLINSVAMMLGGIGALITSPFTDQWEPFPIHSFGIFSLVMVLLIIATASTFALNSYLLHFYSATFLLFFMFVDPLYTAVYGYFFLEESITIYFLLSVFFAFLGLYIFYREELKEGDAKKGA